LGTKIKTPFLNADNKNLIIGHIRQEADKKDIYLDFINGCREHVNAIISLNHDQNISKLMNLIKGGFSFWINKNGIIKSKWKWAYPARDQFVEAQCVIEI